MRCSVCLPCRVPEPDRASSPRPSPVAAKELSSQGRAARSRRGRGQRRRGAAKRARHADAARSRRDCAPSTWRCRPRPCCASRCSTGWCRRRSSSSAPIAPASRSPTSRSTPRSRTSPSAQKLTLEQLPEKLASEGIDYPQYRVELKREIARQILRQRDVVQRIVVTPRELDQYLEHQKKTASAANEYNVSHILIAVAQDAKPAQLAQVEQAGARDRRSRAQRRGFRRARGRPIRRARARSKAARSAGARAPSCRPSWPMWSRA